MTIRDLDDTVGIPKEILIPFHNHCIRLIWHRVTSGYSGNPKDRFESIDDIFKFGKNVGISVLCPGVGGGGIL